MADQIAEDLRQLAVKCSQCAKDCADRQVAKELEEIGVDLAQKAEKLKDLFKVLD